MSALIPQVRGIVYLLYIIQSLNRSIDFNFNALNQQFVHLQKLFVPQLDQQLQFHFAVFLKCIFL